MFGLDQFTAVLNPPQAAILAVGASQERPVVWEGQIVARPTMTMTLTCDHRAVDGAPAAEFLETVKAMLEDLSLALVPGSRGRRAARRGPRVALASTMSMDS